MKPLDLLLNLIRPFKSRFLADFRSRFGFYPLGMPPPSTQKSAEKSSTSPAKASYARGLFWNSLSRGKQIAAFVLLCHILFLFALSIHHLATPAVPKKHIAVRTVSPRPPISTPAPTTAPPAPVASAPKKSAPPPAKPQAKPKASAKKVSKPSAPDPAVELSKSLEALASLPSPSLPKSTLSIPKALEKKSPIAIEQTSDPSYGESLVFYLQNALILPEFGEVKALLELAPDGSLQNCAILASKSQKNAEFLKNQLPRLPFPCFNGSDNKQFTLVFRNVENP